MHSWEGVAERDVFGAAAPIARRIREALGLRTSRLGVDDLRVAGNGKVTRQRTSMRARFAMRFGDEEGSEDEKRTLRKEHVRTAFNSPFWPFVLASTSVGQEGLDFHLYCHAVVHWNIPSNPVDLEQREGRVHRFKGHAVRRNVAAKYGRELGSDGMEDPWAALFDVACEWRDAGCSDLIPFWVFPLEKGAAIERHVPNLPMSRDSARYAALRRSLVLYRMVFGQPRQEDLLEYLAANGGGPDAAQASDLMIDLTPGPKEA
ncbi:MAG: helicase-related protein, partial [bacterium]